MDNSMQTLTCQHRTAKVGLFPHQRLEAYRVGLELIRATRRAADRIPRGYRNLADQMMRASLSTVLLTAEGANRYMAGDKRQRFRMAQGECGECAAAAEVAKVLGLVPDSEAMRVQHLAGRVAAMLTRLIRRQS
jgi:four helix bundle protein